MALGLAAMDGIHRVIRGFSRGRIVRRCLLVALSIIACGMTAAGPRRVFAASPPPSSKLPDLRPVPRQPPQRPPVPVAAAESRFFLAGDDRERLWRKTLATIGAQRPLARIVAPDFAANPPSEGVVETSWTPLTLTEPAGTILSRAVVHVVPEEDGLWIESDMEGAIPEPLLNRFPSFSAAAAKSPAFRDSGVQAVAMWWPERAAAADRIAQVPTLPAQAPPQWQDPVVTLPPVYSSSPSFNLQPSPTAARFGRKVVQDYVHFYSCDSLVCVTGAVGAAALMANTGFDTTMENAWQASVAAGMYVKAVPLPMANASGMALEGRW